MNNIKKLFTDNLVEPVANSYSSTNVVGEVLISNERENVCRVKFTNSKGNTDTRDNVSVFIYNKSIIDWFPLVGDKVLLQEKNNKFSIIGPADTKYANMRSQVKLENDIYSDSFISGMGGYIF